MTETEKHIDELREKRDFQDGSDGLSPTDASASYLKGYMAGREKLKNKRIHDGICRSCGQRLP